MAAELVVIGLVILAFIIYWIRPWCLSIRPRTLPTLNDPKKTLTWIIHMYPPYHNAGAEWMAHCLNRYLVKEHGYTINVFIPSKSFLGYTYFDPTTVYEGVNVYSIQDDELMKHCIKGSRAVCSHLNFASAARDLAGHYKKPYVHFLHNSFEANKLRKWMDDGETKTHLVANSNWIRAYYDEFGFPTKVLYPPVFWKDYDIEGARRSNNSGGQDGAKRPLVTMINCNKNKGGDILPLIAEQLPEIQFAGVRGGYDKQIIKPAANLKYLPNTPHIQDVYAQTRILLVPSAYESWGRVAVEAMSSGIPVIANPTPGLKEALGTAGIFCYREDIPAWTSQIKRLVEDEAYYEAVSKRCRERARELDPIPQMNELEQWLP